MRTCRVEHNRRRLRMQVRICESRLERGRGMLWRPLPDLNDALLLQRCRAVHTIGMRYSLDVLFCDATGRILRIVPSLRPGRVAHEPRAVQVWELRAGAASHWGWRVGDSIVPC